MFFTRKKDNKIKELETTIDKLKEEISGLVQGYAVLDASDDVSQDKIRNLNKTATELEEKRELLADKILVAEKGLENAGRAISNLKGRCNELYSKCTTYEKRLLLLSSSITEATIDLRANPDYDFLRGMTSGLVVSQSLMTGKEPDEELKDINIIQSENDQPPLVDLQPVELKDNMFVAAFKYIKNSLK